MEFLASFPEERRRFGDMLEKLPAAWLNLLRKGSVNTAVHEDLDGPVPRIVALGVSAFVTDDLLAELKNPPLPWLGPELVRRVVAGDDRILSPKQVREANSREGLNLVVFTGLDRTDGEKRTSIPGLMDSFNHAHVGFRLKEFLSSQPLELDLVTLLIHSGASLWDAAAGQYVDQPGLPLDEAVIKEPFLLGCTRESAMRRLGIWFSTVFSYTPPQIYFRPAEQRLLLAAMRGLTDEELADELSMSLSGVKKIWQLIYERAAKIVPDGDHSTGESNSKRGKQKKQLLLTYLREHLQELRPVLPPRNRIPVANPKGSDQIAEPLD